MKYLNEIAAWLIPIKNDLPDSSYQASAIDSVLQISKEIEDKLESAIKALKTAQDYNKSCGLLDARPDKENGLMDPSAVLAQYLNDTLNEITANKKDVKRRKR